MYEIRISNRKNKKYSVFKNGKYLLSFGDKSMKHYKDSTGIGAYSHLDHLDPERRRLFWLRHKPTKNKNSARYWARFLW